MSLDLWRAERKKWPFNIDSDLEVGPHNMFKHCYIALEKFLLGQQGGNGFHAWIMKSGDRLIYFASNLSKESVERFTKTLQYETFTKANESGR